MSKKDIIQRVEDKFFTDFWGGTSSNFFTVDVGPFKYNYTHKVNAILEPIEKKLADIIDEQGNIKTSYLGLDKLGIVAPVVNLEELYDTFISKFKSFIGGEK